METSDKQPFNESGLLAFTIGKGTSLVFCRIPPGSYLMGSPDAEEGHEESEGPQHRVVIIHGFHMSRTPITRRQWSSLMGPADEASLVATHPMTEVSWDDSRHFIRKLHALFPKEKFRLPTESEWEYACRAGSSGCFASGENEADLEQIAWYAGNSGGGMHPVGEKRPNAWGLYDMHGNVFEWCEDWDGSYLVEAQKDPPGPVHGQKRILRGGCYKCPPQYCRSANRYSASPDRRARNFGFRLVLAP